MPRPCVVGFVPPEDPATLAMHLSDGLIDARTSLLFAAVAVAGLTLAVVGARRDLDDRAAPMAGLLSAFVFAAQMINFPVLPGVSGHLMGGALAAVLVGPWVGALCVGMVVVLQALLFADGGLTALGANVTNMAFFGILAAWVIAGTFRAVAVRSRSGLLAVCFVAGLCGTVAASLGFVLEYALGGQAPVSTSGVVAAVAGVHGLIGIGEGIITAFTVGAVAAVRPDLVYLLRDSGSAVTGGSEVRRA